jgi:glycosyltransferase involved in cell wall biosynthesis
LDRSLTILLPVENARSTLSRTVIELVEVAAELTSRFELLIIDDGSIDETEEVAHSLAQNYPQVRVFSHRTTRGYAAAIQTGLRAASGEIVLAREKSCRAPCDQLHLLWKATDTHPMVLGRPALTRSQNLLSSGRPRSQNGFRMVIRHAVIDIEAALINSDNDRPQPIPTSMVPRWHEIEMGKTFQTNDKEDKQDEYSRSYRFSPREPQIIRSPNLLGSIKKFALGE